MSRSFFFNMVFDSVSELGRPVSELGQSSLSDDVTVSELGPTVSELGRTVSELESKL